MYIKMLSTHRGCEDGFAVRCYMQGAIYHVRHGMGCAFIRRRWAVEVEPDDTTNPSYIEQLTETL